ncbi:ATP-grasp peptide maturase system methyltransferase [Streptomyces paromomycinus]|uniref:Protein-L-isoaspartate O-methyltransferase n=1 Tax=Streptomyces paromomycinus TaxID=92743 RepID=A0A401W4Q8_STREY|nr:ATP-grasp peptide maturase system methyltransferase [Streptomyces paromomycinus]GCD44255.1 SAM-dependent methyltransferase [Streptomyces paromomycinus]
MNDSAALRHALADQVAAASPPPAPVWIAALAAVPRERFMDHSVYRPAPPGWEPVHRARLGEEEWLRMVYTDQTWVTQVDGVDAADAPGPVTGVPTSSGTRPTLVVRTLHAAGLRSGDKVLEIGTGTGYSTALLCHSLGHDHVVSVEYDTGVARRAATRLHAAGYAPTLIQGDGLRGHQEAAEYDAVVATCSVRTIPRSWIFQITDAGSITCTLSGWMLASGMIRLTLDENGDAHGRFLAGGDSVSYMLARPHERPPRPTLYRHPGDTRPARIDPSFLTDPTGRFVAQLGAPSAELVSTGDNYVLIDVATGSQAWTEGGGADTAVHQRGPLRLWDQVEDAVLTWQKEGAPDTTAFGMTAAPEEQYVWLGSPDGPRWFLPV